MEIGDIAVRTYVVVGKCLIGTWQLKLISLGGYSVKSFMIRFQQRIDLPGLSLLFLGFEVMLLKNALVLCLNDEYTDSTKLLSPKGFLVVSEVHLL
jgi:hypothetical protein